MSDFGMGVVAGLIVAYLLGVLINMSQGARR